MKTFSKTILCLALALCAHLAQAQYFDWVMTYQTTKSTVNAIILDMDADSDGNIYFIGGFATGGTINGVELLPSPINHTNGSTCIVKMSPSGEMLWHKAISHYQEGGVACCSIQVLGDSAVMCATYCHYPDSRVYDYLYWLDTLVYYPFPFIPTDSTSLNSTAFLTVDLEGNLKEQHFLNLGLMDTLGMPIVDNGNIRVAPNQLGCRKMHVDSDGNIILETVCGNDKKYRREPCDTCEQPWQSVLYSVENGNVGAVRIMVDGTRSHFFYPENRPIMTNARLL